MFKKLIMALAVVGITAMPFAATAAASVQIESQTTVANVSTDNTYRTSASAVDDQVVAVQLWYHNREEADSGKIAQNVKAKISLPTAQGSTQVVTGTVAGDNTNTVTSNATINVAPANAYLEYISGSAIWRHNVGDNTHINYVNTKLTAAQEQALLSGGVVLGNQNPCFNFESTVTIQVRIRSGAVTLQKQVKVDGSDAKYAQNDTANPGDTLDYVLIVKNAGNTVLKQVQVVDTLPAGVTYVPGSTRLVNSLTGTAGKAISDDRITAGGITIDDMNPGSTQYVYFKAKVNTDVPCGTTAMKNLAYVKTPGLALIYNQAVTTVNKTCTTTTTPPATPEQPLPQTGAESALAGITSTGVLGYTVNAYRKSKRSLANALKNIKR